MIIKNNDEKVVLIYGNFKEVCLQLRKLSFKYKYVVDVFKK